MAALTKVAKKPRLSPSKERASGRAVRRQTVQIPKRHLSLRIRGLAQRKRPKRLTEVDAA